MNVATKAAFSVIGISVRTTNENGQSGLDIPALWGQFMEQGILDKIPDIADHNLYCIYTDYEKDHTRPYTTLLGCRVTSLDNIPDGMTGKTFAEGPYTSFLAKGNLQEGVVFDTWQQIWNSDIPRAFTADFEVYGEKAQNPADAEVEIFIAVR